MKQNVYTVGIDLAKKIFHLVGTDTTGKMVWRKRLTRTALAPFMAQLPPVTIGMEAWGGAHYWARQFHQQGHRVKLMAPQGFVKLTESKAITGHRGERAIPHVSFRQPAVCR
jgi:transposase